MYNVSRQGHFWMRIPWIINSVSHAKSVQNNIGIAALSPVIKLSFVVKLKPKEPKDSGEQKLLEFIIHTNIITKTRLWYDA